MGYPSTKYILKRVGLTNAQKVALDLLSSTELGAIDGVTAGTALASKALILNSSKGISQITTLGSTTVNVGADALAGTLNLFPTTTASGKTAFTMSNNTGNTTTTINIAAQATTRAYTIPDFGGTDSFVGLAATQALTGKTYNGLTITTSTGTLTIANLKVLTVNNTMTLAGGDSTVMTFPNSTDTVVTLAATQTLTGKTLTSPAITGPTPVAVGSSLTINATTHLNAVIKLDTAGGSVATLPAATGTGNTYYFVVTTTATSNAHKILCASSSDNIIGLATGENTNTAKIFQATTAGTFHSIQMPFAGSQPSGGFQGDWFEFHDTATNVWWVRAAYHAGTTPTTPFSTATS